MPDPMRHSLRSTSPDQDKRRLPRTGVMMTVVVIYIIIFVFYGLALFMGIMPWYISVFFVAFSVLRGGYWLSKLMEHPQFETNKQPDRS
ncbi:MAG: hypothetical protein ACOH18_01695 [Candidatus Saccharimonadaceae bacterium]